MYTLNEKQLSSNSIYEGFEIIRTDRETACFVNHCDLYDFECFSGFSEQALFWAAAKGEKIQFNGEDWTVDFLLPFDPSAYSDGFQSKAVVS
jgi:hypothetical protein